jgi:regulatory protein
VPSRHVITAIEPQQRRPERRSIFLDGEFALGVDAEVIARTGLRVGQEVELAELQALARAEERRAARDAALRLLGFRDRSERELERLLLRKGFEAEVVSEVVSDLAAREFVDDERFARGWVAAKTAGRPIGPDRLAAELRARGVERETVEEAVAQISPENERELALRAAKRLVGGLRNEELPAARRKLAAALRRRGFSWEVIRTVCDTLIAGSDDDGADECGS